MRTVTNPQCLHQSGSLEARPPLLRIVIVDDHSAVRAALRAILRREGNFSVVGDAPSGPAGLELVAATHPDVLLLDLSMPGMSGFEVMDALKTASYQPVVIAVSMNDEEHYVSEALSRGFSAFVPKSEIPTALVPTIRKVMHR
jgi:DNA-binding NarL/FixJ family response regulator